MICTMTSHSVTTSRVGVMQPLPGKQRSNGEGEE